MHLQCSSLFLKKITETKPNNFSLSKKTTETEINYLELHSLTKQYENLANH